jgi:hypothetical protein
LPDTTDHIYIKVELNPNLLNLKFPTQRIKKILGKDYRVFNGKIIDPCFVDRETRFFEISTNSVDIKNGDVLFHLSTAYGVFPRYNWFQKLMYKWLPHKEVSELGIGMAIVENQPN